MIFKEWLLLEAINDIRNMYKSLLDFLRESQEDLYVNFSDRPRINMKLSLRPSHHDPIGIYAFTKRYMLQENRTNEGFWSMPYIYVFKLSEKAKVLNLSKISIDEAKELLEKMGISDYTDKPYWRSLHGKKGGHLLWYTMEKYIATNELSKNVTWNKLFAMAGNFDAILDEGDSIIHSNEPEQICVINPSVINVVKTVESPMAEYSKIIWRKMYDIANSVGMKYFSKYSIQSKKTGRTETARRYNFKKTSDFGATNNFSIDTISEDPKARYVFSIGYHLGDGTINCYINMPDKTYIDVYSKRFDQHGYGKDYALINIDDWEIAKKEIHDKLEIIIKSSNTDPLEPSVELLNKIIKIMGLPNAKITITSRPSFCAESITQININKSEIRGNLKISICPDLIKNSTTIYLVGKLSEFHRLRPSTLTLSNITVNQLPEEIDSQQIVNQMKEEINEQIANIEKHEASYMYTNIKRYLIKILENYF
jgi:hypothetical protein